jgi:hypothetical protein
MLRIVEFCPCDHRSFCKGKPDQRTVLCLSAPKTRNAPPMGSIVSVFDFQEYTIIIANKKDNVEGNIIICFTTGDDYE